MRIEVKWCTLVLSPNGSIAIEIPKVDREHLLPLRFGIPPTTSHGWTYEDMFRELADAIRNRFAELASAAIARTKPVVKEDSEKVMK